MSKWNAFLEDGLPLIIAAASAALSFVMADPNYVIFGAPLTIVIKTANSLVSSPPATPAAALPVVQAGAQALIQQALTDPKLTIAQKALLQAVLTLSETKVPTA